MSNEIRTESPETRETERKTKVAEASEKVVESAVDLGRVWARYGLSIGKMALETSATSLKTTAGLLGAIAEAFETKPAEPASSEPESAPSV
jgi:hypothetical protein